MSRAFVSPLRQFWVTFVILGCFGALFWRLVDLHLIQRPHLLEVAQHNREVFKVEYSRRGNIYDDHGGMLATTRSVRELGVDPLMVTPSDMQKLPQLAKILGLPVDNLQKAFTTLVRSGDATDAADTHPIRWAVLSPAIEESTYDQVLALNIKAVYGSTKFDRIYPGGELAAHVLGYMGLDDKNKDEVPQGGVEKELDFYLRGQDGWEETEQDGHHQELEQFTSREVKPTDGLNVELTLDTMLQTYAQDEVARLVKQYTPQGVTIIISEPRTGDILALANYPTFDPNHYRDYPLVNLKNRALSDVFEPGSTFKIVTASAALNENIVRPQDTFDCSKPTIEYDGRTHKLPMDDVPNGVLSVSQIVSRSSNRGAANIGVLLGPLRLHDYAASFGFGQTTGLGLPGESRGDLQPTSAFDRDTLLITRVPMGQGVDATALQVNQAMSVIANHGILMEPRLVRRVFDGNGNTVVQFQPKIERRVISEHTADLLNSMLCDVVSPDGTAVRAKLADITVAGKTGTAQKVVDGHYSPTEHVSTFSGYLPAERPRLVITVIVDDAHTQGIAWGGTVAAPAFHNVAALAVQYLGIQPINDHPNNMVAMKGDNLDWFR
jgi:cell division protein FtsI/penicillin-binding protein 2